MVKSVGLRHSLFVVWLLFRFVNLRSYFDPVQLAEQAVNLNLRLMLWRASPNLDMSKIASARCLLLGKKIASCDLILFC